MHRTPKPKFSTQSRASKTVERMNLVPSTGELLKIRFSNLSGTSAIVPSTGISCFCEGSAEILQQYKGSSRLIADEVGGMANYGVIDGPLSWKGTGRYIGCVLPNGYSTDYYQNVTANYKDYKNARKELEMGVRSTDFHLIQTPGGNVFWLIVVHLSVGNLSADFTTIKRYRILKSIMAQAHYLKKTTGHQVVMIGDFNTTRADLLTFKQNEEGRKSKRGTVLIPKSLYNTTIGEFKTCFQLDGSSRDDSGIPVDLYTNLDFETGTWFDIDHFFVPIHMTVTRFEIDRSVIGQKVDGAVIDHGVLRLDLLL